MKEYIMRIHDRVDGVTGHLGIGRKPLMGAYWQFWNEETGWGSAATVYTELARAQTVADRLAKSHGRPVDIRPAFAFTCDVCGRESFFSAEALEVSWEDLEAYAEANGIDLEAIAMTGKMVRMPAEVDCMHCKSTFPIVPPSRMNEQCEGAD